MGPLIVGRPFCFLGGFYWGCVLFGWVVPLFRWVVPSLDGRRVGAGLGGARFPCPAPCAPDGSEGAAQAHPATPSCGGEVWGWVWGGRGAWHSSAGLVWIGRLCGAARQGLPCAALDEHSGREWRCCRTTDRRIPTTKWFARAALGSPGKPAPQHLPILPTTPEKRQAPRPPQTQVHIPPPQDGVAGQAWAAPSEPSGAQGAGQGKRAPPRPAPTRRPSKEGTTHQKKDQPPEGANPPQGRRAHPKNQ